MCSLVDLILYELASLAKVRGVGFTSRTWGGECLMKARLRSTPATLGVLQVGPMSTNCRSRCWMGLHYPHTIITITIIIIVIKIILIMIILIIITIIMTLLPRS